MPQLKIATWNVNGNRARQAQLLDWVAAEKPDVVCLQELKASPVQLPPELCELEGYWCYWHGEKGYSGVGLHVRRELVPERPVFAHPSFDFENRVVMADLGLLTIVSIYVPNGGKDFPAKMEFLESIRRFVAERRSSASPIVMCGDFNVARTEMDVHPKERKPRAIGQLPEERQLLEQIIADGNLVDVGRALDPDNDQLFTWWAPWRNLRQRNIGWRLDYVLVSESLASRAVSCPSFREVGTSDHAPVLGTFAL